MTNISANLTKVLTQIAAAAQKAGRGADQVRLTAVSKTHPQEAVRAALQAGQRLFGENRVQEAAAKFPALRGEYPDLKLHLIGPLQTNKVAEAVALFDGIETLDRPKLAAELAKEMKRQGRAPKLYVQVNIGREPQKTGIAPEALADFLRACRDEYGLKVEGLMCIPPFDQDPAPFFTEMKRLAALHGLAEISMGMSGDFEAAIACGASHVRIGTAIFGQR